jgi:hypothetical protein
MTDSGQLTGQDSIDQFYYSEAVRALGHEVGALF